MIQNMGCGQARSQDLKRGGLFWKSETTASDLDPNFHCSWIRITRFTWIWEGFFGQNRKFKRFFSQKTGDLQKKKDLHRNWEGFFGQNQKFKRFLSQKTGDLQKKRKGLHQNWEGFFGKNQKFKQFFCPKTGDLQKKKVFTEIEMNFLAKIENSNGFLGRIAASTSQLRHPNSFGGAVFIFSAKIGLKITKNVSFCILNRPMGGAQAPPPHPPWLCYWLWVRWQHLKIFT